MAARDGGIRRDLSPAALAASRCVSVLQRRAEARSCRHHCACAGHVAGRSSCSPAGQSQHRRTTTFAAGKGCAAGLQHGGHARRRAAQPSRDRGTACQAATACNSSADAGSRWIAKSSDACWSGSKPSNRRRPENGLPFAEAMRLVAGASLDDADDSADAEWSELVAGPWLAEMLQGLRQPEGLAQVSPGADLKATLRPYQQAGVRWLYLLTRLGMGACLADDMGLGKTIQVLSSAADIQARRRRQDDGIPTQPVGRPGVADGQLGRRIRALLPRPAHPDRASLGVPGCRIASAGCRRA